MNENDNENENCPSDGIASRFTLLASRSFPPPRGSWKGLFTLHTPVRFLCFVFLREFHFSLSYTASLTDSNHSLLAPSCTSL